MCEERILKSGKIKANATDEAKKQALMEDPEYVLNQILYNMKGVIIELYAWIFVKAYGPIDVVTAEKLLRSPGFKDLYELPDFKSYAKQLQGNDLPAEERQKHVLFTGFEFIKEAVIRWKSANESKYLSASRRIRFLHSAQTVGEMKYQLEQTNKNTAYMAYLWKPPSIEYLSSLPKL